MAKYKNWNEYVKDTTYKKKREEQVNKKQGVTTAKTWDEYVDQNRKTGFARTVKWEPKEEEVIDPSIERKESYIANKPVNKTEKRDIKNVNERAVGKSVSSMDRKNYRIDPNFNGLNEEEADRYEVLKQIDPESAEKFINEMRPVIAQRKAEGNYVASNFGAGMSQTSTGIKEFGRQLTKDFFESTRELTDKEKSELKANEVFQNRMAQVQEGYSPAKKFGANVINAVGQAVPGMAAATLNPALGVGVFATGAAGNYLKEAEQAGATKGQKWAYGLTMGAVEAALEKSLGMFGFNVDGAIMPLIRQGLKKNLGTLAKSFAKNAAGEGAEEFAAEIIGALMQKATYDPDRKLDGQLLKDAAYSGLVGAASGGIMYGGQLPGDIAAIKYGPQMIAENSPKVMVAALALPDGYQSKKIVEEMVSKEYDVSIEELDKLQKLVAIDLQKYQKEITTGKYDAQILESSIRESNEQKTINTQQEAVTNNEVTEPTQVSQEIKQDEEQSPNNTLTDVESKLRESIRKKLTKDNPYTARIESNKPKISTDQLYQRDGRVVKVVKNDGEKIEYVVQKEDGTFDDSPTRAYAEWFNEKYQPYNQKQAEEQVTNDVFEEPTLETKPEVKAEVKEPETSVKEPIEQEQQTVDETTQYIKEYAEKLHEKYPDYSVENYTNLGKQFVSDIEKANFGELLDNLHQGNPERIKLFNQITGNKVKTDKEIKEAIRNLDPEAYDVWAAKQKAASEEETAKAKEEAKAEKEAAKRAEISRISMKEFSIGKDRYILKDFLQSFVDVGYMYHETNTFGAYILLQNGKHEFDIVSYVKKYVKDPDKATMKYVRDFFRSRFEAQVDAQIQASIEEERKDMEENPGDYLTDQQLDDFFAGRPVNLTKPSIFTPLEESTNSKTGDTIYQFELKDRVDKEQWSNIHRLVKQLKGNYWKGKFYFRTSDIQEATEKYNKVLEKFDIAQEQGINEVNNNEGGEQDVNVLGTQDNSLPGRIETENAEGTQEVEAIGETRPDVSADGADGDGESIDLATGERGDIETLESSEIGTDDNAQTDVYEMDDGYSEGNSVGDDSANDLNFTFDDLDIDSFSPTAYSNFRAIELVKRLERENRSATEEEQRTLASYKGWGGLKKVFVKSDRNWDYNRLKNLLTEDEYKAARASQLNAHYTSTKVINAMYHGLETMGFNSGRILEPSMGTGNFFGALPKHMRKSKLFGVELDTLTGKIAKYLYPGADIRISGFQDVAYPDNFFDVAVGNVPFANISIPYKGGKYALHDFFFIKTLDHVKEGGLVMFITSSGTMGKANTNIRKKIMEKADLVAAFKLPETTFKKNANTEVTTDVIILRKREAGKPYSGHDFLNVSVKDDIVLNEYFVEHPDHMLGKLVSKKGMYEEERTQLEDDGRDIEQALYDAMDKLPKVFSEGKRSESPKNSIPNVYGHKKYTYVHHDNKLYYVDGENLIESNAKAADKAKILDYLGLKKAYDALISTQSGTDQKAKVEARKKLNTVYDEYVNKHGNISNVRKNKILTTDAEYDKLSGGLEIYDFETKQMVKSEIFTQDTNTVKKIESVGTAQESLIVSLNESGKVNLSRMSEMSGKTIDQLIEELSGQIIDNTSGTYELIDVYLSGNIYEKLREAELAAEKDEKYLKNVELLKQAMPERKTADVISPSIGAPWIGRDVVMQFVDELGAADGKFDVIYEPISGSWNVYTGKSGAYGKFKNFSTDSISFAKVLEHALNMRSPRITYKLQDGSTHVDVKATEQARMKVFELNETFNEWVFKDRDRRERLVDRYNELFNSRKLMSFDNLKNYLKLDDLQKIKLENHQKRAVARILFNGDTLLAHGVGAGKTYEMIAAAHELKRMGIAKKPIMVVPNHKVTDFEKDYMHVYPQDKILVAQKSDFEKTNRVRFFSKIASNNWDCIIIPHSSFVKIPISDQRKAEFIEEEIAEIENAIRELRAESGKNEDVRFIKNLEKTLQSKKEELKRLLSAPKDEAIYFEDMGIDTIFVDEAHNYKNLSIFTKLNVPNVKGTASQRAADLFMKTKLVREKEGTIVFATATPITNTVSEMYNMTRYVNPSILKDSGINSFDSWAATFGNIESVIEMSPDGKNFRAKERFTKYKNVQAMIGSFRQFADIIKSIDVIKDLPVAERIEVVSPETDFHEFFLDEIVKRIKDIQSRGNDKSDNMLLITNDGRAFATDARLVADLMGIDPKELDFEGSKINKAVENIFKEYKNGMKDRSTQIVFLDLGTSDNSARYKFNLYKDFIDKLVAHGIPRKDIGLIHEADSDEKKKKLFEDVNSGKVRIILGSTSKMGEGMNVQERAVALHHLNAPYRPSDIEQREGRIIRRGNSNKNVRIYNYVQEKSFDSFMWQMLARKAVMIEQAMSGDTTMDEMEEVSEFVMGAKEAMATATGNPLIMKKVQVDEDVKKYQGYKRFYNKELLQYEEQAYKLPQEILGLKKMLSNLKEDADLYKKNKDAEFLMVINGKEFKKPKDAGAALIKATNKKSNTPLKIGTFKGFDIYYYSKFNPMSMFTDTFVELRHKDSHQFELSAYDVGNVARLNNTLERLESWPANIESNIAKKQEMLDYAQVKIREPFKYEEQLKELMLEQSRINTELGIGESQVIDEDNMDDFDDEDEAAEEFEDSEEKTSKKAASKKTSNIKEVSEAFKGKSPDKMGIVPQGMKIDVPIDQKYEYFDPDREKAHKENRLKKKNLGLVIREFADYFKRISTRTFKDIDENDPSLAEARKEILNYKKMRSLAADEAARNLNLFVQADAKELSREEFNRYERYIQLRDLMEDIKNNLTLPGSWTEEIVEFEFERLSASLNDNIRDAINRRDKGLERIKNEYIQAMAKVGFNVKNRFTKENYFRHQVLEYYNANEMVKGAGSRVKINTNRGNLKQREGTMLEINENYLEAEYEVLFNMIYDTQVAQMLNRIRNKYDITKKLKRQAKAQNEDKIRSIAEQELQSQLDKMDPGKRIKLKSISEYTEIKNLTGLKSDTADAMVKFNQRIAIGMSKLQGLAERYVESGEGLWSGDGRWDYVIETIAEGNSNETSQFFTFLSELASDEEYEGNLESRSILSAIGKKESFIKEVLGGQYLEWRNSVDKRLIPDDYSEFQPIQGKRMMSVNTISDQMAETLMKLAMGETIGAEKLDDKTLKVTQMLAFAGDRLTYIIPDPVTTTLEDVYSNMTKELAMFKKLWGKLQTGWKMWILQVNPRQIVKYNLRNISGDLDALIGIAGFQPLKYTNRSARELYEQIKFEAFTPDLKEFFERGGFQSDIIAQEIIDINQVKLFKRYRRSTKFDRLMQIPQSYTEFTSNLTRHREAVLRYAAYLYFKDVASGKMDFYYASKPSIINGLDSVEDKAFQLSDDVMGAYDQVTELGQGLRKYLLPFYSFQETNFKRYFQTIKNAKDYEKLNMEIGKSISKKMQIKMGTKAMAKLGYIGLRIMFLTTMLDVWNKLVMKDEDEELPDDVRSRPHITLGRRENGEIIYFTRLGALTDLMDWFGLDTLKDDIEELNLERMTIPEMIKTKSIAPFNKLLGMVSPFIKSPFELMYGSSLYPDPMNPSRIRDKGQYIASSLGLREEYDRIKGLPVSKTYGESFIKAFVYTTDPGQTAYYKTLDLKSKFEKVVQKKTPSTGYSDSAKSKALYYMKLSLKYGDEKNAIKFLEQYYENGGTDQGLKQSLNWLDPFYGLSEKVEKGASMSEYDEFIAWLTPQELETIKKGEEWYLSIQADAFMDKNKAAAKAKADSKANSK